MELLAVAAGIGRDVVRLTAEDTALFQINLFQVIIAATNFVVFLALIWTFAFKPVSKMLADRKERIEQGLKDAEQARRDRESAESERVSTLTEARREANDILARAQKVAQETRDADIAATKDELERMRVRAAAEIEAEKTRAIADVRAEVADLALLAAGRVVGETMSDARQRRLVEEFLAGAGHEGRVTTDGPPRDRHSTLRRGRVRGRHARRRPWSGGVRSWRRPRRSSPSRRSVAPWPIRPPRSRSARPRPTATFSKIVSRPVLNLIDLMLRRGRIEQLPHLADEFRRLDNQRQGITLATATSASPLSPDEVRALTERMEQYTGGRIELDVKVDPSLLGGLIVRVGDRLIDGSVRSRLERLRNQLVSGAL